MNSADLVRFFAWLRRYPFCVICSAVALATAITSWFLWQQVRTRTEDFNAKTAAGENMRVTLVSGSTLRADLAYAREYTQRIDDHLVVEDNLSDNQLYFYGLKGTARLDDMRQLPSPPPETDALYKRIPFSLKLTGSYDQLAGFLRAVETGPRLANITAFSFRRGAPPSSLLTLDLSVELLGKL